MKGDVDDDRLKEIRMSIAARHGKSMFEGAENRLFGPTCRCGIYRKPPGLAKHVIDDGLCTVHPEVAPQPYVPGAGP